MAINNVSTYNALQGVLQNVGNVQSTLNTDEIQISSGYIGQTFQSMNGNVDQFVSLNAQVSRLQNYQQNNATLLTQMNTTTTSLSQITQIANSLQSLISSQMSGTGASTASFNQQLSSSQSSLVSELNTTYAGSFIFGGTDTATAPVKSPVPAPAVIGTPDASYYQGSSQDVTSRVADGQTISNSVRADNPAFQQIFAGIAQAMQAGGSATQLQSAENLISNGLQGVIALSATVNANIVNVQDVNTQSQSFQTYFTGLTDSMSKSDVVSLSSQVAQDQSVLEASFETYARISQLTIASYLK